MRGVFGILKWKRISVLWDGTGVFDLFLAPPACVLYIYIFEDLLEEAFVIKNEYKKKKKRKNQVCEYSVIVGYGCRKKKFCLLST